MTVKHGGGSFTSPWPAWQAARARACLLGIVQSSSTRSCEQPSDTSGAAAVALEGKRLRRSGSATTSPRHVLGAVGHAHGVVLAQRETPGKASEISEFAPCWRPLTSSMRWSRGRPYMPSAVTPTISPTAGRTICSSAVPSRSVASASALTLARSSPRSMERRAAAAARPVLLLEGYRRSSQREIAEAVSFVASTACGAGGGHRTGLVAHAARPSRPNCASRSEPGTRISNVSRTTV